MARLWLVVDGVAAMLTAMLLVTASAAAAQDMASGWSASLYAGPASYSRISDIFGGHGRTDGAMIGLAVDKSLFHFTRDISLGVEAQLTEYGFGQTYATGAFGIGFQFDRLIWDDSSLALYSGPSYAPNPPKVPDYHYGPSYRMVRFLNYVGLEWATAIPGHEHHWDAVLRFYHRSGAWGIYSDNVDEGSMIGVGLRARF